MKKILLPLLFSLSTLVLANETPKSNMAGGWSPAPILDVEPLAKFALSQQPGGLSWKLVQINTAERQVVAGINTKMSLTIKNSGQISCASAIVFTDLQQQNHLTSWDWKECR